MAASENLIRVPKILLIVILLALTSCSEKTTQAQSSVPPGGVLVTVVDYSDLDGCTFLLVLADGQKLQPINLKEGFKKLSKLQVVTIAPLIGETILRIQRNDSVSALLE